MNKNTANKSSVVLAMGAGLIVGGLIVFFALNKNNGLEENGENNQTAANEPIYWVAPMDPNYRRDKPGKSPMGMDLIPVYAEGSAQDDAGVGVVEISPEVINNLGVRTQIVERNALDTRVTTVGYVQYDENHIVHIHPRISGWVEKLYVKSEGSLVKKGAPLYALYSPELVNAQDEFVLAIKQKKTSLIQAAEVRLKALKISDRFIKTLKSDLSIRQTVTFYAPQNGAVDNLKIREGYFVEPATTIMSIGALNPIWVEGEIFERQASLVSEGDAVTMTLDYLPGKTWKGKVDYIYPMLDAKTRTLRVRMRINNSDSELKPNMYGQLTIHSNSQDQPLVIPREALIRTGSQDRAVLALGQGRFKSVAVTVGRISQDTAEIISGLSEGERVVTSAQFLLDSESSKSSDFKRYSHGGTLSDKQIDHSNMDHSNMDHSNMDHSNMDHSNMDHSNMDHSNMDHSNMDHSNMDHSNMDHSNMEHSNMDHSNMDHSNMDHSNMDHSNMDSAKKEQSHDQHLKESADQGNEEARHD